MLDTPFFRRAVVALFLSGFGVSAVLPQLTLFFTRDLGASPTVAGFYYLTNAAAPVVGYVIGRRSDVSGDRLTLFRICSVVGLVGFLAMAGATQIWMPFVISVVLLSVSGAASAQLFAAARDELNRHPTGADNRVIATIRMAYTAGFIVGPVVGSVVGGIIGLRWLLVCTAVIIGAQQLPLGRLRVPRFVRAVDDHDHPAARPAASLVPLIIFSVLCVLALSGDTAKIAYLPIYMDEILQTPDAVRGAVMACQPLLELILIPIFGHWSDRIDPVRLVTVGAAFGTAANLAYALAGLWPEPVVGLFVGQVLMSCLWGAMAGLGVSVAQSLYPDGVGVASSVFLSSITFGTALGGAIGGLGVAWLGLPHVFLISFVLAGVSVLGLIALSIQRARSMQPNP